MKRDLTVFIPAYNEQGNIAHCVDVVQTKMAELGVDAEILIVDDCSHDGTGRLADELAGASAGQIKVIHHLLNKGIGGGFVTALEHACGEWMILIPADLPLCPDELKQYMNAALKADIVVGLRSDRSDYTFLRRIISWTNIRAIQVLFGMKLKQYQYVSMYKVDVLRQMKIEYWRSAFFLAEILIKARDIGCRLVEVDILYAPRLTGKASGAKARLLIRTAFDMLRYWTRWIFTPSARQVFTLRKPLGNKF